MKNTLMILGTTALLLFKVIAFSQGRQQFIDEANNEVASSKKAEYEQILKNGVKLIEKKLINENLLICVISKQSNHIYLFIKNPSTKKMKIYLLSKTGQSYLDFEPKMTQNHPWFFSKDLCNEINNEIIPKSFNKSYLVYVKRKQAGQSSFFYKALYFSYGINNENGRIIPLGEDMRTVHINEISDDANEIKFNPTKMDTIYVLKDKKIITLPPAAAPDNKPPATTAPKVSTDYIFNHSCSGNMNFTVLLDPNGTQGTVSVHNNVDKTLVIQDTTIHVKIDTIPKSKPETIKIDSTTIIRTVFKVADTIYSYGNSFDGANFSSWLKNKYPLLNDDCSKYLAYKIGQEIMLRDAAYMKFKYVKNKEGQKDTSEGSINNNRLVKPGTVFILPSNPTLIQPIYSQKKQIRIDTIQMRLKLTGDYDSNANQVHFTLLDTTLSNNLKIKDTIITISENEWNISLANNGLYSPILYAQADNMVDTLRDTQYGYIVIKGQSQSGSHTIKLNQRNYNPSKPFWVEVGTNFDFADGLQPNNFFGGVFLYERDIRPSIPFTFIGKRHKDDIAKPSNFGIFAGVFESKSVTDVRDSNLTRRYYDQNSLALIDTLGRRGVFGDTGVLKTSTVVKNIGLFFSPQIRLTNGTANTDGLHVSLSLWIELQWQRISNNIDYSGLKRKDTTFVRPADLNLYATPEVKKEIDVRSHYIGIGLPIFYKRDDANAFINPVIGISNQPGSELIRTSFKTSALPERSWQPFYMFQFRLNEEHFGMAFTGEVRGLLKKGNPPFVSLALTKKFDLSKFLDFK